MATEALCLENLEYLYRGDWLVQRRLALKGISLTVNEGESFGFLGHNGAGKTTTIKCILNLIHPRSGKISIFGRPHNLLEQRRLIGYLPEQPYFYDHLSVFEIMEMYADLSGISSSRKAKRSAIDEVLNLVRLEDRRDSRMRTLSKGLTQRVALAQAIIGKPTLLILDEPFSGLDPIGRKEFREIMMQLRSTGTTIFLSSHILSDVEFLCDRVSIMAAGEIRGVFDIQDGTPFGAGSYELIVRSNLEFKDEPFSRAKSILKERDARGEKRVFNFDEREDANAALSFAISSEAVVDSFRFTHGTLEELFVELVQQTEQPQQ